MPPQLQQPEPQQEEIRTPQRQRKKRERKSCKDSTENSAESKTGNQQNLIEGRQLRNRDNLQKPDRLELQ